MFGSGVTRPQPVAKGVNLQADGTRCCTTTAASTGVTTRPGLAEVLPRDRHRTDLLHAHHSVVPVLVGAVPD
jgi:hypothetical protein